MTVELAKQGNFRHRFVLCLCGTANASYHISHSLPQIIIKISPRLSFVGHRRCGYDAL